MHNAKKHSNATKVIITLAVVENYLCLFYRDDGVGIDPQALAKDKRLRTIANSGFGLEQMKSRVLHLSGHLELLSDKGSGVELSPFGFPYLHRKEVRHEQAIKNFNCG